MSDAAPLSAVARITNKRGLHARAAAKLVEAASRFKAHITVSKDGHSVEACSIMGLLLLAASLGSEVEISAKGEDAREALTAILALIAADFGEE
jgi:phosphocarrier protein HPr